MGITLLATCYMQASKTHQEGVSCNDVYVDDCAITCGDNVDFNVPSLAICQVTCVLTELCTSWTYDQTSQTCDIIYCDLSLWLQSTCNIIGAPSGLDLDSCLQTNEGCGAFKQGACTTDESYLIRNIYSIDQADCQYFCELDAECAYFISSYNNVCDMYSKKPLLNCDRIIGPAEPRYEEC